MELCINQAAQEDEFWLNSSVKLAFVREFVKSEYLKGLHAVFYEELVE